MFASGPACVKNSDRKIVSRLNIAVIFRMILGDHCLLPADVSTAEQN